VIRWMCGITLDEGRKSTVFREFWGFNPFILAIGGILGELWTWSVDTAGWVRQHMVVDIGGTIQRMHLVGLCMARYGMFWSLL